MSCILTGSGRVNRPVPRLTLKNTFTLLSIKTTSFASTLGLRNEKSSILTKRKDDIPLILTLETVNI